MQISQEVRRDPLMRQCVDGNSLIPAPLPEGEGV